MVFKFTLCIFKYLKGDFFSLFNNKRKREVAIINARENPISSLNLKISCKKNTKIKLIIKVIIYLKIFKMNINISFVL